MSRYVFWVALATVFCVARGAHVGTSECRAAEPYRSASSGAYSSARPRTSTVNIRMSFRDQILASYDANGNGRLDGKERLKAQSAISKYRAQKGKYVYAQQRYRQAVRTAQTAYVQAAMRQRPMSFSLAPSYSRKVDCKDVRHGNVKFSSPAMRRVKGPPPSSSPGLIHVPAAKVQCCVPSG